jgi:hypothetical protein
MDPAVKHRSLHNEEAESLEWRNHSEHEDGKVSRSYWPRSHERRSLSKQVELLLEKCLEIQGRESSASPTKGTRKRES